MQTLSAIRCWLFHAAATAISVVDHWQTLIAGCLALTGAWLTVRKIRQQIDQANALEKDRLLREERAARIMLPMALSALQQYAIDCIKLLLPFAPTSAAQSSEVHAGMTAPHIPANALEPIQTSAKFADDDIAEQIGGLVRWLQVQHARLEGLIERASERVTKRINKAEAITAIIDAAELHARVGGLFPYSRGVQPDPSLTFQGQLQTAVFLAGVVAVDNPDLAKAIKARTPHTFDEPSQWAKPQDGNQASQ